MTLTSRAYKNIKKKTWLKPVLGACTYSVPGRWEVEAAGPQNSRALWVPHQNTVRKRKEKAGLEVGEDGRNSAELTESVFLKLT